MKFSAFHPPKTKTKLRSSSQTIIFCSAAESQKRWTAQPTNQHTEITFPNRALRRTACPPTHQLTACVSSMVGGAQNPLRQEPKQLPAAAGVARQLCCLGHSERRLLPISSSKTEPVLLRNQIGGADNGRRKTIRSRLWDEEGWSDCTTTVIMAR